MNPDNSVKALASTEVDISQIQPGKAITVLWRGKPVFVKRRTPEEIAEAKKVKLDELKHPEKDEDRVKKEEWLDYWEAGQRWFTDVTGHQGTDQVCKDAGRCYYVKASKDNSYPLGTDAWAKIQYLNLDDIVQDIRAEKKFQAKVKADLKKRQQELLKTLPKADRERLERYKKMNSKEARTTKAQDLGAVIKDGIARKIKCPRCNRPSVWFALDSTQKESAECNHKNSCGWFGFVNNL